MKIAFLHYTCGLINRGSEISTKIIASYLCNQNHQVWIYQLGKLSGIENYQTNQIKLPWIPKTVKNTSFIGKLLERIYLDYNSLLTLIFTIKVIPDLLKTKPEIIIPTNGFWQVLICKLVKALTKSKIVIVGRAGIGWTDKDNIRLNPDLFIGLSMEAVTWARSINPAVKAIFLPNPIDIESFLHQRNTVKVNLPKPIILTVAALTSYKNIDKLILASSKIENVSLLIVGVGELYKQLDNLGKENLKNRFSIISCEESEMLSIYKQADLFVLLSGEQEAFGRVFLEAMVCGLAIVTTDTMARRNIIGENGIYLKNLDINTIVKGIEKGLRLKPNKSTLQKQLIKFDIKTIGPLYEKEFLDLLYS